MPFPFFSLDVCVCALHTGTRGLTVRVNPISMLTAMLATLTPLLGLLVDGPASLARRAVVFGAPSTLLAGTDGGSRLDELKTLGTRLEQSSGGGEEAQPEFWPGRLEGRPPPKPSVVLRSAPPMVLLPGFGNDAVDYVSPNGWPKEVGLVSALERRGVQRTSVVPIERSNWLNVARGLSDLQFVAGNAEPEGPAFAWYIERARATVEAAVRAADEERVVLVGHSAGGWLARALCVVAGDEWARRHVRGIVTLGARKRRRPRWRTKRAAPTVNFVRPARTCQMPRGSSMCATSAKVVATRRATRPRATPFTSYNSPRPRPGRGRRRFVPRECASLAGATQLTLDCYHSGGKADPWPKDDWYGAERHVEGWRAVAQELEQQRRSVQQEQQREQQQQQRQRGPPLGVQGASAAADDGACDEACKQRIADRRALFQQSRTTNDRKKILDLSRQRAALYNTTFQRASCIKGLPCY